MSDLSVRECSDWGLNIEALEVREGDGCRSRVIGRGHDNKIKIKG